MCTKKHSNKLHPVESCFTAKCGLKQLSVWLSKQLHVAIIQMFSYKPIGVEELKDEGM